MINRIALGLFLIILTGLIHTSLTGYVLHFVRKRTEVPATRTITHIALRVDFVILLIIAATILEAGVWALGFVFTGALPHFEEALYFSLITYTTLGYGDIVLSDQWRLLAAIEAANGIIMFGWSTSLVVIVLQSMKLKQSSHEKH